MSSKKKQPKCMDINNYIKVKKLTKNYINQKREEYRIYDEDIGDYLQEDFTLEQVNKYINELKKNDIFKLLHIHIEKITFINVVPSYNFWEEPELLYTNDIIKYVKLFLFRKIGVMSIVNLIMNGNYFTNGFRSQSLTDLIRYLKNNFCWDYEITYFENYFNEFDNYELINGMCNNFKKLQYLE
jgi:hypothetical protein